jgi:hypothetical protein
MLLGSPAIGKLFGMTGYLLSVMFILAIIMMGAPAHLH